ncbi:hypothetical protein INT43_004879 [Umbelopsis isabellina]|uniref:arginine--tRNA ligase n=1 Tax=Mortierella isabellina TaxID=91625 RepID=A0A8H7PE99_MORIS|nr:hypothetical protein INT43_004879 [Umbelopsis isabellina]
MASSIEGSSPATNPLDSFKNIIAEKINALCGADLALIHRSLEAPRSPDHGDFALAVPKLRIKGNPAALAKEWAGKIEIDDDIVAVTSEAIFVNFKVNSAKLIQKVFDTITEQKEKYGRNDSGQGKTVVVEYSSPNIAKPFHAGHLRSTIIGAFVRNVYEANGWKTISMNYLGDWGKQYGLLAVGYERYGNEEDLTSDPINHLFNVYVSINRAAEADDTIHDQARAYFKRMEDGDEEALALWRRFRDLSIVKYKETYARLNIQYDVYSGESQVGEGMRRALDMLKEMNLLEESDGAKIIDLSKYKLGSTIVTKKDGTTLYLTRDIGAAMERYEKYQFDRMIYVVASQQDLHLKQLFKVMELMKFPWADRLQHINFGMVTGMSTRKGTVVFLDQILNETKEKMHDVMRKNEHKYAQIEHPEQVADEIGMSAVKVQDNAARRIKNYEFDWDRMFSFEGDTGPYLQYAHARLCSIERKSGVAINPKADISLLGEPTAQDLIKTLGQYPDLVKSLPNGAEPCNVVTYAFKLSHDVSSAFESLWVMGAEEHLAEARMLLYWSARVTLGNALRLLGLKPLERM